MFLLLGVAAVVAIATAPARASGLRGPRPFELPSDARSVVAGANGSAVYVVRGPGRTPWARLTARPGDRKARNETILTDASRDRLTAWFATSTHTALFASEFEPRPDDGSSVVQVIPVPAGGVAQTPITVSSPGSYASDPGDPAIGPRGGAALLFRQGVDFRSQSLVLALKPAGLGAWLPPTPLPDPEWTAQYVLFSGAGDAVLLSYPNEAGRDGPAVRRIDQDGALGPMIDLGFDELGLPVTEQVDFEAAFTSDGALHAAISLPRDSDRPKDPSRLVVSRLAAGSDYAEPTTLGSSVDPEANIPSLSLAPGPGGSVAVVAGQRKNGDLRVFESKGAAPPRLTATIRASTGTPQAAMILRAPDGGLNLVWYSNALGGRGYDGLMGAHRGPKSRRFSKPKPLANTVLARGSITLDGAAQLPDGNVAIAYSRYGGEDDRFFGLIARP